MSTASGSNRLRQVAPDEVVPEATVVPDAHAQAQVQQSVAFLLLALKTVSQRFVIAINRLFTVAAIASVAWIFYGVSLEGREPSMHQLIAASLYGLFVLACLGLKCGKLVGE